MSKRFVLITVALVVVSIGFFSVRSVTDFDTGYHLTTGEFILDTLSVPTEDIFSFTASGEQWVSHYWLGDVIFAGIYRAAGLLGVIWFVGFLSALTYGILLALVRLRTQRLLFAAFAAVALGALTFELWVIRPQVYSYLLFVILLLTLEATRRRGKFWLLFVVPLFLLWVNMHASIVFGIATLGLWVLAEIVRRWQTSRDFGFLVGVSAIAVAVTLLNPSGLNAHLLLTQVDPYVEEFFSLVRFLGVWQADTFFSMILIALGIGVWQVKQQIAKGRDFFWPMMLIIAGVLPLLAIRHVGFFPLIVLPAISPLLAAFEEKLEKRLPGLIWGLVGVAALALLVFGFRAAVQVRGEPVGTVLPVAATKYLDAAGVKDPLFHPPAFGGYLIWQRWPDHLVFADGRNDVYGDAGILLDYRAIIEQQPGWEERFEAYGFNAVMIPYRGQFTNVARGLSQRLVRDFGFILTYQDDMALVLVREVEHPDLVELQ